MKDLISVIIPVYKVEDYLERCLDSVINNTYKNLEIICVDDGSPDRCPLILDRYADIDNRIKVIHKNNGGISSARNAGMDIMTGDYVAFIDSDDWIHPDYFKLLLKIQSETSADICVCDYIKVNEMKDYDLNETYTYFTCDRRQALNNPDIKQSVWGKIYNSKLIKNIRFDESVKVEDAHFNVLVYEKYKDIKIAMLSKTLYFYYMRNDSLMSFFNGEEMLALAKEFETIKTHSQDEEFGEMLSEEIIKRCLITRYTLSVLGNKSFNKECNQFLLEVFTDYAKAHVPLLRKIKFGIMCCLPCVYRLFRIIDDPTMLDWERNQKRLRNNK